MPRIYVADLASYNNGVLHGAWFDLTDYSDVDDLKADIQEKVLMTSKFPNVLVECPECEGLSDEDNPCERCNNKGEVLSSEEYAIHVYDDISGEWGEYPNLEKLLEYVKMVEEHGEAWNAFIKMVGAGYDITEDVFNSAYVGQYDSEADFAEEYAFESGRIDKDSSIIGWIDWQHVWDYEYQHDFSFEDGYVFRRDF